MSTEFSTFILPNGIRCILKRIKSPVAYCALSINAGSRDELESQQGVAHFTEHLLFKGTKKRRAHHINNRLEKLGGELNAFTTKEETVVHATTLRADLPKAIELIADVVFNSTFPEKEVEKEKEVIIDEINSYKDSPAERLYDEFEDRLFAGSTLGHNILGSKRSVNNIDSQSILKYTLSCYNTDEMVLSIAADINEKYFVRLVERIFADYNFSRPREFQRQKPAEVAQFNHVVRHKTHQAHCMLGARAYDFNHPNRLALSVLINILGGPCANSRLNTILREKKGLTYNAEASYTSYSDCGLVSIYFSSDKDNTACCVDLVSEIIKDLRSEKLTALQLLAAKKQFAGQLAIAMENKESYMLSVGKSYMVYNEVDSLETLYRKLNDLSSSDILIAANEIFAAPSLLIYR